MVEMLVEEGVESFVNERRLAATAHASYTHKAAQWQVEGDILQVVARGAGDDYMVAVLHGSALGEGYVLDAAEVVERECVLFGIQ